MIKSPFSEIDFKEVVEYSLEVRSDFLASGGVENNRAEPGSQCRQSDERSSRRR